MSDRGVRTFVTVAVLYFVSRDLGTLVVYSRREGSYGNRLKNWLKGTD